MNKINNDIPAHYKAPAKAVPDINTLIAKPLQAILTEGGSQQQPET
jgi:hypothetical protein